MRRRRLKSAAAAWALSLEFAKAEGPLGLEPASDETPEKDFDRRWALTLLDRVLARLALEARDGEADVRGIAALPHWRRTAAQLRRDRERSQESVAAVKVAVHRLRKKFRDVVRDEIAQTVASPADIEDELRHLWSAVRR